MNIPRKPLFWAVGLGHLVNDMFMSMGPVVLTFLRSSGLAISNSQIGLADGLRQLTGAFSQPGFGLVADRSGGRRLGAGGVAWTVTLMLLGLMAGMWTGNFWVLIIPYVLSAMGSGAFHPVGSLHAAESDRTRIASSVSWFFMMGQLGLALGPFLAGSLLESQKTLALSRLLMDAPKHPFATIGSVIPSPNLSPILLLAPLAIPAVVLMALTIPTPHAHRITHPVKVKDGSERAVAFPIKAALLLLVIVAFRSLAQPGAVPFIPTLFEQKGWTPQEYGLITGSYWLAAGLSGIWFGSLADRYDRRWVLMVGMVASAPGFFLLPHVDGILAFGLAILGGGLSGGSHSIIVVLAQELFPSGKGFASGMTLGTIFGLGAVGSFAIGFLSDNIGLASAFHFVAVTIALSGLFSLLLPKHSLVAAPALETIPSASLALGSEIEA